MPDDPKPNWHEWDLPFNHTPRLMRPLTHGRTNQSYLVEADGQLWVLRINSKNSEVLGIDRQRELIILEQASTTGLAPKLHYCSVEQGVLITEFIDGLHWQVSALNDRDKLSSLTEGLHRIHALEVATLPFDYKQHAENYWQQLIDRNISIPDELSRQRENMLPLFTNIPVSNVVCHHDPSPHNIIVQSHRLYFLDWEYAAPGWPALDFAALSSEWNIPVDKLATSNGIDIEEIKQALDLYVYLCDLWSCLRNPFVHPLLKTVRGNGVEPNKSTQKKPR